MIRLRDRIRPPKFTIEAADAYRSVCENLLAGEYRLETQRTSGQIYANQIAQNLVVMWMVVTITISGVLLAGVQLWTTYRLAMSGRRPARTGDPGESSGAWFDASEASISKDRLVVRSSVIGVMILALSFAFFAVYVRYVYRISDLPGIDSGAPPRDTKGAREIPA